MNTDTDYTHGFQQALAGFPLVSDIDASYSGSFITGWLDGRESSRKTPIKNEYTDQERIHGFLDGDVPLCHHAGRRQFRGAARYCGQCKWCGGAVQAGA